MIAMSYKKLWKLLIDKNISKTELSNITKLSKSTIAKLTKNQNVNTNVLVRICECLNCDLEEIVEIKRGDNL